MYDLLAIVVPAAIGCFLPVIYISILIGEPDAAMTISVFNTGWKELVAVRTGTIVFNIIVATFFGTIMSKFQFGFYVMCTILAVETMTVSSSGL